LAEIAHHRLYGDIFTAIGATAFVELTAIPRPAGVRLFAKLEGTNPTGSIKDRIVYHMLAHAQEDGRLQMRQPVVEASTGNTGIALAMIGRRLGHPVEVIAPENAYPPIARLLQVYGARLTWTPAEDGVRGAMREAERRAAATGAYFLDQFHDRANCDTHYDTTGPEIHAAIPEPDVFVAGVGTGGTITGAGRYLKERFPHLKVVAAEAHPVSQVQGLANFDQGFMPPILDTSLLDAKILVRSVDAFRAARELVSLEGIFGGVSAGAVLHVARIYAERLHRLGALPAKDQDEISIVCVFADAGWKYLDSHLWLREPAAEEDLEEIVWW
jgi:cysteine synthase B